MTHVMPTYGRQPITFTHGEGVWLWDTDGNKYLDGIAGIAVCGLGHAHPAVTAAVCDQAGKLIHTSNLYQITLQEELADRLCRLAGMDNVFFCNSGAEANEAAIKLARRYGHEKGVDSPTLIVTEGSFHGRTLATLSATGNRKIQAGFEPLVSGFNRVPYNDIEAIRQVGANNPDVVALLVEPIQGEGGVVIPDADYLRSLRRLCDEHGWLLMLDEIQTGLGRTGRWFAFQHEEMLPDVLTLAKSLGNGLPIGACLTRANAAGILSAGSHGSTFGGNPLACRAALAVLHTIDTQRLVKRAEKIGQRMIAEFHQHLGQISGVDDIRGKGLMVGITLNEPCADLVAKARQHGVLINVTAEKVVRLLPPLIITDEEVGYLIQAVATAIKDHLGVARHETEVAS